MTPMRLKHSKHLELILDSTDAAWIIRPLNDEGKRRLAVLAYCHGYHMSNDWSIPFKDPFGLVTCWRNAHAETRTATNLCAPATPSTADPKLFFERLDQANGHINRITDMIGDLRDALSGSSVLFEIESHACTAGSYLKGIETASGLKRKS